MKLLICGDRNWVNAAPIYAAIQKMKPTLVIHGGARGADQIAGGQAFILGVPVKVFKAHWERYGRGAGPVRNQQMLKEGKPDFVLAFHSDIANSKGTKDMLERAKRAGIKTKLITK